MWSSTALLLAHHESGSELNLASLVCCPHCPQHFLCAQGHNEYDTLLIGEVGGLQRHVLRLAQLLICICKAGDRARAEGPSRTRNGSASDGRADDDFNGWFSSLLSRVWSESVKSPSKNVCGVDGVDAGDVFRSRPEQILQIIRTWRRFPEKVSCFFFLQAADSGDHPSTQALYALRCALCICFDSPLHNFSAPRRRPDTMTRQLYSPRAPSPLSSSLS